MINVGDIVVLRNSAFASEFQTFDWSDKYLYEDAFNSVHLWFKKMNQRGECAKTFLGGAHSIIQEIEYYPDLNIPFIIVTDLFSILYLQALNDGEIQIQPFDAAKYTPIKADGDLIDDLEFYEQMYLDKLLSVLERENNKQAMYKYGLVKMIKEKKFENKTGL